MVHSAGSMWIGSCGPSNLNSALLQLSGPDSQMGSSTFERSESEVPQFLVCASVIDCGCADMNLQRSTSLKVVDCRNKLRLQICGYAVA
jgi:hypothetical protein